MDINQAVFLKLFILQVLLAISLFYQVTTEVGSAGEQPARDIVDVVEIKNKIAVGFSSTAILF